MLLLYVFMFRYLMKAFKIEIGESTALILALATAAILKIWLMLGDALPFNADEAVVALMARHIHQGGRPIFFYGQAYMGSLDAALVALGFVIFGQQVWVIRLVQLLLYLGVIVTTAQLGKVVFGSWQAGALAAWLLAIPTVNVTLYTTVSLGGYGEALLLGNLILLAGFRLADQIRPGGASGTLAGWGVWAFLVGLGLWAFGLTLVYTVPSAVFLAVRLFAWIRDERPGTVPVQALSFSARWVTLDWHRVRGLLPVSITTALAFLLGSAPWWVFALQTDFGQLLWELRGGAIASAAQAHWVFRAAEHVRNFLLLGSTVILGLRPPWDVTWLAVPLIPFVLMFWIGVTALVLNRLPAAARQNPREVILFGLSVVLVLAFIFSHFGADPSGRYFVPLAVPMALFAGQVLHRFSSRQGKWTLAFVPLLLLFHLWGTVQCVRTNPPGITTQFYPPAQVDQRFMPELIAFLREQGERRGYTNYWVSYPLAFLSGEELVFVPRLPYHLDFRYTERDDRYRRYDDLVEEAERVAYITTHHPELNDYLREQFAQQGIGWQEKLIGDFQVFYDLSRPVRPTEIGLGHTTQP